MDQTHAFFKYLNDSNQDVPLNWDDVMQRKITPAFQPETGQIYIDSEAMSIPISCSDGAKLSSSQTVNFQGFTYNKDASSFIQRTPLPIPRSPGSPAAKNRSNDSNYSNRSSPATQHGSEKEFPKTSTMLPPPKIPDGANI